MERAGDSLSHRMAALVAMPTAGASLLLACRGLDMDMADGGELHRTSIGTTSWKATAEHY